jgi:hypothetical protein
MSFGPFHPLSESLQHPATCTADHAIAASGGTRLSFQMSYLHLAYGASHPKEPSAFFISFGKPWRRRSALQFGRRVGVREGLLERREAADPDRLAEVEQELREMSLPDHRRWPLNSRGSVIRVLSPPGGLLALLMACLKTGSKVCP